MHDTEAPTGLKRRHIAAVTLGNALEFYDFLTYSFFAIQIGHALFPSTSSDASLLFALAVFWLGFLARPIGAIVIGLYADRVGRKPALLLSFVLMGVSIVAMALIPPFKVIGYAAPVLAILVRMAQGFSLGGEIGSNTAFLLEAAPLGKRGFIVSWQGASQEAALLCGSLVGIALTVILKGPALDAYGWRIAFLLGGVTVPFGLWMRSRLPETLFASEAPSAGPSKTTTPDDASRLQLAGRHWRIMILGLFVLGTATIANYVSIYIVTYAQDSLDLSLRTGFLAETANTLVGFVAALAGGWVSDRLGRRPVNIGTNIGLLLLIIPLFMWVVATRSALALIVTMSILGIFTNFSFGSFCATLAESLPKRIRVTAFGSVYSMAIFLLGGSTQYVVKKLIVAYGPMSPAWYVFGAALIGQVALMLIPESAPDRVNLPLGAAVTPAE
jgi:MHS family citrate/tricarballylate:H+ symporter-like MFS transporter